MRERGLSRSSWAPTLCVTVLGCASPEVPVTQTIQLQTPGCEVASCELSNDRGRWYLPRTPGSVTVTVSRQPLRASCRADDSSIGASLARSSLPSTSGAGAATGAVVGGAATVATFGTTALAFIPQLGIIAVVAGATAGAAAGQAAETRNQPLRYPELVSIPMNCATAAASIRDTAEPPRLGLGIRGMSAVEAQAAGVSGRTAVLVTAVVEGSLAATSALREGDVILALNGQDVNDAADLEERVRALPADAVLTWRIRRDGRSVELALTRAIKEPS